MTDDFFESNETDCPITNYKLFSDQSGRTPLSAGDAAKFNVKGDKLTLNPLGVAGNY